MIAMVPKQLWSDIIPYTLSCSYWGSSVGFARGHSPLKEALSVRFDTLQTDGSREATAIDANRLDATIARPPPRIGFLFKRSIFVRMFACIGLLVIVVGGCANPETRPDRHAKATTLPLLGDPIAGERLFYSSELACAQCHRVGSRGGQVAPDLTNAHARFSRDRLATKLLRPGDRVSNKYRQTTIADVHGRVYSGTVHRQAADPIELYQSDGRLVSIRRADIEEIKQQALSPMPNDYGDRLTVRQFADLIEFLKQPHVSREPFAP